jgi:phosphatidate cytidylyltransferase
LILLIIKGSYLLFAAFVALVSFIGLQEFYRMTIPGRIFTGVVLPAAGAVLPMLFYLRSFALTTFAITLLFLVVASYTLFRFKEIKSAATDAALLFFGLLYIPFLLGFLVLLRNQPSGWQWILLIMAIVMGGDSAAYFIGCRFGKRKLYPAVSPNKSVEGSIGGIAGSMVGVIVARMLFFSGITLPDALIAAVLIGVISQTGDLFESLLKRSSGVKDSGSIFPGHGGILDRLDSILFAAPVAYYYAAFVAGRFFN